MKRAIGIVLWAALVAGCSDEKGERVKLWYVDRYAAPGEKATLAVSLADVLRGHVMWVEVESGELGLARTRVHDGGRGSSFPRNMRTGDIHRPNPERFKIMIPKGAAPRTSAPVRVEVAYRAAVWVTSGATYKEVEGRETVGLTLRVVAPGGKLAARARDLAIPAALLVVGGLLLGLICRMDMDKAHWALLVLGILAFPALAAAGLFLFAIPLAQAFGWIPWWVRGALAVGYFLACAMIGGGIAAWQPRRAAG